MNQEPKPKKSLEELHLEMLEKHQEKKQRETTLTGQSQGQGSEERHKEPHIPPPFSDIHGKISVLGNLHRVSELIHQKEDSPPHCLEDLQPLFQELLAMKLPHSGRKMLTILQVNGAMNQRTLAQKLNISPQAVSETVKKLESAACVVKVSGSQKNENLISLTDYGEKMADLLLQLISRHAERIFKDFTMEEVNTLRALMKKLLLQIDSDCRT